MKDPETALRVTRLSTEWTRWKSEAVWPEEMGRLREAVRCRLCLEACVKAVSLPCCTAAACRKCALASIKEDCRRCWGCGGTEDMLAPSHLVNSGLVRFAVDYLKSGKQPGEEPDFKIFALLSKAKKPLPVKEIMDGRKEKRNESKLTRSSTWGTSSYAFGELDQLEIATKKKELNKSGKLFSREWYSLPEKKISTSEQLVLAEKMKQNAELETRREPKAMTEAEKRRLKELQKREKEKAAQTPEPPTNLLDFKSSQILAALEVRNIKLGKSKKPPRVYKPRVNKAKAKADARKRIKSTMYGPPRETSAQAPQPAPPLLDLNSPHILLALEERNSRLGKCQKSPRVYKPRVNQAQTDARNRKNSTIYGHVTRAASLKVAFPNGGHSISSQNVTEWAKLEEQYGSNPQPQHKYAFTSMPLARGWDTDR